MLGARRKPRVRPDDDREELRLLACQNLPEGSTEPKQEAKTDAELRVFLEDELVLSVKKDFGAFTFPEELLRQLAQNTVQHYQVELDLNIERFSTQEFQLTANFIAERVSRVAYRYDTFLRSLRGEDEQQKRNEERKAAEELSVLRAVRRVVSGDIEPGKLPTNLVDHMLRVGMEQHLLVVRRYLIGDTEALGITITFKNLTMSRRLPKVHVHDKHERRRQLKAILRPQGPQTVWSATANTLFGCCFAVGDRLKSTSKHGPRTTEVQLLKQLNGVIRPGKVTLLFGPKHSGKSRLLSALAGQIKSKGATKVSGDVWYNGHRCSEVYPSNICTIVEQTDVHLPMLTVRETLEFAFHCRGQNLLWKSNRLKEKTRVLLDARVDFIMAVLGLTRVADNMVGNETVKGISGGELRRLTLGEILIMNTKVLLCDEISTGLDAASTYDIVKSIRSSCRVFNTNCVMTLFQPQPETIELCDDVILMASGNIVHHGPRAQLRAYFESIQFTPDPKVDLAEFLYELSLNQTELLLGHYKESDTYQEQLAVLACDPKSLQAESAHPDHEQLKDFERVLMTSAKFNESYRNLFRHVLHRQWTVFIRNRPVNMGRMKQDVALSFILGALYFAIPFQSYYLVSLLLFLIVRFAPSAQAGAVFANRAVFYKQTRQNYFPASVYVASDYLIGIPFSLMDAFLLGSIAYFMAGLSLSSHGQPYFVFLVIFLSFSTCMGAIVRFWGYVSPSAMTATTLTIFFAVFNIVFSGAVATPAVIPPYFIWIHWAFSPMSWAYRSLMQNEFYSLKYEASCDQVEICPNNLQGQCVSYCGRNAICPVPYPQVTCGVFFLEARQVETDPRYLWLGIGMLWIYTALFLFASWWVLRKWRYDGPRGTVVQADAAAELFTNRPSVASTMLNMMQTRGNDATTDLESKRMELTSSATRYSALIWRDLVYTIMVPDFRSPEIHATTTDPSHASDDFFAQVTPLVTKRRMEKVDLIKNVTGFAKPYTLTALMGPSGAGKTTLLDCLCYRKTIGKVTGKISLNSQVVVPEEFKKDVGYVEQFGIHSAKATVRESLEFSALLRLPREYDAQMREKVVVETLDMLGLTAIASNLTGGLSFEQRKRLTIAVELVSKPLVLFVDEPTTGLTSKQARITMHALTRVAECGTPIIATVHQPSMEIFSMFHRLLLLRRGGRIAYFGELGDNCQRLVDYFQAVPGVKPLPAGLNPAKWMLDVIGGGRDKDTTSSSAVQINANNPSGYDFAEIYQMSDLYKANQEELEELLAEDGRTGEKEMDATLLRRAGPSAHVFHDDRMTLSTTTASRMGAKFYRRSYAMQFRALLYRNFVEYWRTPGYSLIRWVLVLGFAVIAGLIYLQQNMRDAAGVQSRVGAMSIMLQIAAIYNAASIVPFVYSRKALFYRERSSSMYASFLYAVALQFVEDPYILIEVFLSVTVFYFLIGFAPTASAYFYYVFLVFFFVEFATYLGVMLSSIVASPGVAGMLSLQITQLFILFSGVTIPGSAIPEWLLGAYYLNPLRWAMEGLVVSQFLQYTQVICNPSGQVYTWSNGTAPNVNCPKNPNGTAFAFYLSDVGVNACCNPVPSRPISAKAYALFGWTYEDGYHVPSWLGGNNGYRSDWLVYDYLYVILIGIAVRALAITFTAFVSHQRR